MYECPICHNPGIQTWRKFFLGPATSIKCEHCGKNVGVPYSSMIAVLPLIISILISYYIFYFTGYSILWIIIILILGFSIMSIIHMKGVPLIPKE